MDHPLCLEGWWALMKVSSGEIGRRLVVNGSSIINARLPRVVMSIEITHDEKV